MLNCHPNLRHPATGVYTKWGRGGISSGILDATAAMHRNTKEKISQMHLGRQKYRRLPQGLEEVLGAGRSEMDPRAESGKWWETRTQHDVYPAIWSKWTFHLF